MKSTKSLPSSMRSNKNIENMMKKLLTIALLLLSMVAQAQIPDEVKDILKKCGEKMGHLKNPVLKN